MNFVLLYNKRWIICKPIFAFINFTPKPVGNKLLFCHVFKEEVGVGHERKTHGEDAFVVVAH